MFLCGFKQSSLSGMKNIEKYTHLIAIRWKYSHCDFQNLYLCSCVKNVRKHLFWMMKKYVILSQIFSSYIFISNWINKNEREEKTQNEIKMKTRILKQTKRKNFTGINQVLSSGSCLWKMKIKECYDCEFFQLNLIFHYFDVNFKWY